MIDSPFYIRAIFAFFTFVWILLVAMNGLYNSFAAMILFLPLGYYFIGFFNAETICDCEIANDIFTVTFINTGLLLSLPIITYLNKENSDSKINHIVYLAMVLILLSYPHVWASLEVRHIYKIARSCLETMAITLYIFVLTTFFLKSDTEDKNKNKITNKRTLFTSEK